MEKFNEMFGVLCAIFDKPMTKELAMAYKHALRRFTEDDLVKAGEILMDGDFFPRPGAFSKILEPQKPCSRDSANSAWSSVKHWAWEKGTTPGPMSFKAMRGVCDRFMLDRANEHEIKEYGFAFRSNYEILLAKEEAEENRIKIEGRTPDELIGAGDE